MRICIPELNNPTIQSAIQHFPSIDFVAASDLSSACDLVKTGQADTMLSGLDYTSRDVLLAYRDHFILKSTYFSSSFVCERPAGRFSINPDIPQPDHIPKDYPSHHLVLADGGVNKLPSKEQLFTIVEDSATTFATFYQETPRIALLSYSTNGSGGRNPDLAKYAFVVSAIQKSHPDWLIEGEMQLDTATNPVIAIKKFPTSKIRGTANVLIAPDLNSGNLLYKSLEQFSDFTIAGPLIQGFEVPLADLSRGSDVSDVILTIRVLKKLITSSQEVIS